MQLLGFDAKFFRGFLSELRHVRPKILTLKVFFFNFQYENQKPLTFLKVKKELLTFKRKNKSFNLSKNKNLEFLK